MKTIVGVMVGLAMLAPGRADAAGFIMNRTSWDSMSANSQENYLMGVFDYSQTQFTTDGKLEAATKAAVATCALDLKLNGGQLRKIVNEAYARDSGSYAYGPAVLLYRELITVCRTYVNGERVRAGFKPIT